MSGSAKVQSSEAIEAVKFALVAFGEHISEALTELSAEMRRAQEWLEHDRPAYWKHHVRLGMDEVHAAQQALHRCLMFPVADERPSCSEERAALKKAKARLEYCERKCERVRYWQQKLRHELFEYEGRISQLVKLAEIEVPQSVGLLNRILRALEEYRSLKTVDPRASYDDVSMARTIWDEEANAEHPPSPADSAAESASLPAAPAVAPPGPSSQE